MSADFYDLLEVDEGADDEELKRAYRQAVRRYHPDVNDREDADAQFKVVKRAYETLSNPKERARYDRLGHRSYVRKQLGGLPTTVVSTVGDGSDGSDSSGMDSTAAGAEATGGSPGSSSGAGRWDGPASGGTSSAGSSADRNGSREGSTGRSSTGSGATVSGSASTGSSVGRSTATDSTATETATGTTTSGSSTAGNSSATGTATGTSGSRSSKAERSSAGVGTTDRRTNGTTTATGTSTTSTGTASAAGTTTTATGTTSAAEPGAAVGDSSTATDGHDETDHVDPHRVGLRRGLYASIVGLVAYLSGLSVYLYANAGVLASLADGVAATPQETLLASAGFADPIMYVLASLDSVTGIAFAAGIVLLPLTVGTTVLRFGRGTARLYGVAALLPAVWLVLASELPFAAAGVPVPAVLAEGVPVVATALLLVVIPAGAVVAFLVDVGRYLKAG